MAEEQTLEELRAELQAKWPTMAEIEADRAGKPILKGLPRVIVKEERRKEKVANADTFRKGVWKRDESLSRASGKPLSHSGTDFHKVGEVHHVIPRSLAPERVYDVTNGLLLSKHEHALAEAVCPNAPDRRFLDISGPDDRGEQQTFIWRDAQGTELRRRIG
jgi:5-methylcytosine-specific restriction endonuclease McrA